MKDFIDQAKINGVELIDHGACQFCGAAFKRGIFECMEHYAIALENIDFSDEKNHIYRFLSVDAHALQHPEIHGRWSNHFHLCRLYLILKENINWTYSHSPLLSDFINQYKKNKFDEYLNCPPLQNRGGISVSDFHQEMNEITKKELILKWAEEVFDSWHLSHDVVKEIALKFKIH